MSRHRCDCHNLRPCCVKALRQAKKDLRLQLGGICSHVMNQFWEMSMYERQFHGFICLPMSPYKASIIELGRRWSNAANEPKMHA